MRGQGLTAQAISGLRIMGNALQPFNAGHFVGNTGSSVTVNTTVVQIVELTIQTGNANTTVYVDLATIECVMAS